MAEVITAKHIYKSFGKVKAVVDLSFSVEPAGCFGLLGPNGAGKTTMMKMLYGRSPRDNRHESVLKVFGYDPASEELAIRSLASVAPQESNLDDELNVYHNLYVYSKFYNLEKREARRRIGELLAFMELGDRAEAKIRELSGGMKRRLLIARALLNQPRLLILDEPTTGLDPQVRHLIWEKLRQLRRQGITILLTTHYMEEAFHICDRILIMHQGSEVMTGSPNELLARHIEAFVLEVLNPDRTLSRFDELPDGVRKETIMGRVLFYAQRWEILQNIANSLPQGEYYLRQVNLEDLFLRATGRQLNE